MSQAPHENINISNPGPNTGDHQYPPGPPLSAQNQEPRGISDHVDGSGPIFSLYLEMATEEDKKMAESWKDDADGILIFTGLFSAAVASLISVSIQDLRLNPQDTSNFYLANTYQATINPNTSSSLPTSPAPFTPPNYAIWVNALWFLSLVISITCALLATLLQQWARRYLKVTQPRYSPHKRARIRAFFAEGVNKFLLPWAVEALPTMLHLSLFLFFAGLAVFLWNVNLTIFKVVLSWIGLCTALYGCITFIPIFCHDSPYHTPLSLPVWHFVTGLPFLTFRALEFVTLYFDYFSGATYRRFRLLAERYGRLLVRGMQKMAEESAFNSPSEIDTRAFLWTFDCLDEDHELERFFSGLPGFRSSKMVKDPLPDLTLEQQEKLFGALIGLLDRTSSSDLLPEPVKIRRAVICGKAIGPADIPQGIERVLGRIIGDRPVQSAEVARLVQGWDDGKGVRTTTVIRAIVSSVVARVPRRNDLWFAVAADAMGVPEYVLRNHATHGNDLSLAILIHVVRQQFSLFQEQYWPWQEFTKVLEAASKFDVLDTSPELQHEFCALWNQVIHKYMLASSWCILRPIRNIYLTLHLHTDSTPTAFSAGTGDVDRILDQVSTYPLCNIPGHHPDSTPRIHDAASPTAVAHTVLPAYITTTADAPSSSVPSLVLIDENTTDVPLLDNDISVLPSSHPAHQPTVKNLSNSAPSPDLLTTVGATLDTDTSARTIPRTAPDPSTATASVRPTGEHSLQNIPDLMHPDVREIPPPASPEQVLDVIVESHSSILATTRPGASPRPISAPERITAEGSPKAGSHEDKLALDPPPVNYAIQANTTTILDRPPAPTLPLTTDIAAASASQQGSDTEHAGDPPPQGSPGRYGIV